MGMTPIVEAFVDSYFIYIKAYTFFQPTGA